MSQGKLVPNDPRVSTHTALLNGQTYKYILSEPSTPAKATIFLIHGWPDMGFGWRNQVPLLTSLGLRVVVPDVCISRRCIYKSHHLLHTMPTSSSKVTN